MTNQQAFDKVWDWFVVQKNPPSFDGRSCRYRANQTPNGPRCALGLFIPDEEYTVRIENGGIRWLQQAHPDLVARWLPGLGFEFLAQLQWAHDQAALRTTIGTTFNEEVETTFNEEVETRLRGVARSFSLSIPETKVEHKPEAGIENLSIVRQGAVRDERIGAGGRAEDGRGGKAAPALLQMQEV
jgi:hypothetical protein